MIYVDTGGWYALFNQADPQHARVSRLFDRLRKDGGQFLTCNAVVYELLGLVNHRLGKGAALPIAEAFTPPADVALVRCDETHESSALDWYRRMGSRRVSWVDCLGFAVMQAAGIKEVVATDPDFRRAGFKVL